MRVMLGVLMLIIGMWLTATMVQGQLERPVVPVEVMVEQPLEWVSEKHYDGYHVVGREIRDAEGEVIIPSGFNRPGLEFWCAPDEGWTEFISEEDFTAMSEWGGRFVLLPLNQGCWLQRESYREFVDQVVGWIQDSGMDVILDLHWLDMERRLAPMPDADSVVFWQQVAEVYGDDGSIVFSVYSEPYNATAAVWMDGGRVYGEDQAGETYSYGAMGIPSLVQAVRETGAENLILVGGLDYAFDLASLAGMPEFPLQDENLAYAAHPYGMYETKDEPREWQEAFGFLYDDWQLPVVVTEFGNAGEPGTRACDGSFERLVLDYVDARGMGAIIWSWYDSPDLAHCQDISVIQDYDEYRKNPAGDVYYEWLQGWD